MEPGLELSKAWEKRGWNRMLKYSLSRKKANWNWGGGAPEGWDLRLEPARRRGSEVWLDTWTKS